jgi:hypothetical protein
MCARAVRGQPERGEQFRFVEERKRGGKLEKEEVQPRRKMSCFSWRY